MMHKITLSKRMRMNAELVPQGAEVADIGCDHGYVSIFLARENHCKKIIAMDVNQGPLAIARTHIRQAGLEGRIQCRLSDGLMALHPGEVDTLLIAGMGGLLVCRILRQSPEVLARVSTLVIQAQSELWQVRKTIWQLGFRIQEEKFCREDGKYYIAVRAVRGEEEIPYTSEECTYGRLLPMRRDNLYCRYLSEEREKREKLCQQLCGCGTEGGRKRMSEMRQEIQDIERILTVYYDTDV